MFPALSRSHSSTQRPSIQAFHTDRRIRLGFCIPDTAEPAGGQRDERELEGRLQRGVVRKKSGRNRRNLFFHPALPIPPNGLALLTFFAGSHIWENSSGKFNKHVTRVTYDPSKISCTVPPCVTCSVFF